MQLLKIIFILNTLDVVYVAEKSLCDEIVEEAKQDGRMVFNMTKSNREIPAGTFKERVLSHFINRRLEIENYFNNVAKFLSEVNEISNINLKKVFKIDHAKFQDFTYTNNININYNKSEHYENACGKGETDEQIWECLNKIDTERQNLHASHLIAVSLISNNNVNFKKVLSNGHLKAEFCVVSELSARTEPMPAMINLGVDRVIDNWQKKKMKFVFDNYKNYFECGDNLFREFIIELGNTLQRKPKEILNVQKLIREAAFDSLHQPSESAIRESKRRRVNFFEKIKKKKIKHI